jgi:hypothetical protein
MRAPDPLRRTPDLSRSCPRYSQVLQHLHQQVAQGYVLLRARFAATAIEYIMLAWIPIMNRITCQMWVSRIRRLAEKIAAMICQAGRRAYLDLTVPRTRTHTRTHTRTRGSRRGRDRSVRVRVRLSADRWTIRERYTFRPAYYRTTPGPHYVKATSLEFGDALPPDEPDEYEREDE